MTGRERIAHRAMTEAGWIVLRSGWPDFLLYRKDPLIGHRGFAVELKDGRDVLRPNQVLMHRILKRFGVQVLVIDSNGIAEQLARKGQLLSWPCNGRGAVPRLDNFEIALENHSRRLSELTAKFDVLKRDCYASTDLLDELESPITHQEIEAAMEAEHHELKESQ